MIELGGLGYKVGQERAKLYIDCLKNKYSGEDIGNFKKTLKFKSIRMKNFLKTNTKTSLLNNDVIQDEDIKLFVEVIEESVKTSTLEQLVNNHQDIGRTTRSEFVETPVATEERVNHFKRDTNSDDELTKSKKTKALNKMVSASKKKMMPKKDIKKPKSKKRVKKDPLTLGRKPSYLGEDGD